MTRNPIDRGTHYAGRLRALRLSNSFCAARSHILFKLNLTVKINFCKTFLRLIKNPWSIFTAKVTELSIFGCKARLLQEELMFYRRIARLKQQDTKLKILFEEKAKANDIHYIRKSTF